MYNESKFETGVTRQITGPCLVLLLWLVGWASAGQNTWTATGSLSSDINTIVPHPQDVGTLYAAGEEGVFRSIDGGEWVSISEGLTASTVLSLAIDGQDGDRMYAGLNAGLYTSADGGQTWARRRRGTGCVVVGGWTAGAGVRRHARTRHLRQRECRRRLAHPG